MRNGKERGGQKGRDAAPSETRRERLAAGLRANLLKRKAQSRARKQGTGVQTEKSRKGPTP
jgi:hypothetical protein